MRLAVISGQFAKEFRVILNEARQAVLHAGDILSEALAELVVDALVLLLNGPVEIARQSRNARNPGNFTGGHNHATNKKSLTACDRASTCDPDLPF